MKMQRVVLAVLVVSAVLLGPTDAARADNRVALGWGRLFTNDAIGDANDRWHTGSYTISLLRGQSWTGALPQVAGEILEYRASSEILAPSNLINPSSQDRRYAATFSFGLHAHFDWMGNEISLGGDLVITGPQTGIGSFQKWAHNVLGMEDPTAVENQIEDGLHPTAIAEVGRSFSFGDHVVLRPFVEVQAGIETLVRVGGDVVIGSLGRKDLMLRDTSSGQRFRAVEGVRAEGISFVLGGDMARVFESALLPLGGDVTLSSERTRLRAGVHWQGRRSSMFYGVSYLGPEFDQQRDGQLVGAININLRF
jgi:hypothetical protein